MPAFGQAPSESLDALARAKGMRFGNAIGISRQRLAREQSRFHDEAYRALMARECGVLVAENETKWQSLRPRPGEFRFAKPTRCSRGRKAAGMLIRGHTLIWQPPKWLPEWVNAARLRRPAGEGSRAHPDRARLARSASISARDDLAATTW